MKKTILLFQFIFIIINSYAQMTINGILDSTISTTAGNDYFSFGIEEFANIRFQSRLRDNNAVVFGAVNLIAAAGQNALEMTAMNPSAVIEGENYVAAIDIERLYFRLNFENANFDGGLFRLPFGFGQVWSPSDFLNPKNPLKPDARPRGILGAALSVFPKNDIKLAAFAAAPRDPLLNDGSGVLAGFSAENHWGRASAQMLYSFEAPVEDSTRYGIHRAGFSLRADIEVGFVLDALYAYDYEARTEWDGLSLSAGIDYSFFDGKLIVIAEYLFNGENSSTALILPNRNYIYSGFTRIFNDFTNAGIALISCLDELEFMPVLTFNHDLFQGASLMIIAQAPITNDVIDNGNFIFNLSARLRLRF